MSLKPLLDRIVVKQTQAVEKTQGGIIVPEAAKEKPAEGTVIAVGPEVKGVKAGDVVLFARFEGTEVDVDGVAHLIFKEENILGVVEH